jgi:signal transduction histidine kinase
MQVPSRDLPSLIRDTARRLERLDRPDDCADWLDLLNRDVLRDFGLVVHPFTEGDESQHGLWVDRQLPQLAVLSVDNSTAADRRDLEAALMLVQSVLAQARDHRLRTLLPLLAKQTDVSIFHVAVSGARIVSGASAAVLWLVDDGTDWLRDVAHAGDAENLHLGMRVGDGVAGQVAFTGQQLAFDRLADRRAVDGTSVELKHQSVVSEKGWQSAHFMPIDDGSRVAAVLAVYSKVAKRFDTMHVSRLSTLDSALRSRLARIRQEGVAKERDEEIAHLKLARDYYVRKLREAHDIGKRLTILTGDVLLLRDGHGRSGAEPEAARITAQGVHGRLELLSKSLQQTVRAYVPATLEEARSVKRERVNLSELVRTVVREFQGRVEGRRINLKANVPSQSVWTLANYTHLADSLNNLVDNALYFVTTSDKPGWREVELTVRREGHHAIVVVADDGPGIEPHLLETIFQPGVSTKGPEGAGLGLPSAKYLVELHRGSIRHEGRFGSGAQFVITVPALPT